MAMVMTMGNDLPNKLVYILYKLYRPTISREQRSARAGFCRPGPARRLHGPARGPEFEFRARPVSARGMAKPGPARPGPARPGPGPVRSGSAQQKQFPWDFLKLFNLIKQSLFNGFVGYLFVTDAPQG